MYWCIAWNSFCKSSKKQYNNLISSLHRKKYRKLSQYVKQNLKNLDHPWLISFLVSFIDKFASLVNFPITGLNIVTRNGKVVWKDRPTQFQTFYKRNGFLRKRAISKWFWYCSGYNKLQYALNYKKVELTTDCLKSGIALQKYLNDKCQFCIKSCISPRMVFQA